MYCKTCFIQVRIKSIEYHTYKYFYTKILFFPEFCGKNYVLLYWGFVLKSWIVAFLAIFAHFTHEKNTTKQRFSSVYVANN